MYINEENAKVDEALLQPRLSGEKKKSLLGSPRRICFQTLYTSYEQIFIFNKIRMKNIIEMVLP